MFISTWRWCWKTPRCETQSMHTRTRQSRSNIWKSVPDDYVRWNPDVMLSYLLWWPLLRGWHSQTAYVHAIMTPYSNCIWLSCILTQHTTVCITIMPEWIDYCSSTHSQTDMYHNSWTPPIPACNGDTCRPHPCLLMCYQLLIRYDVPSYIYQVVLLYFLSC